MAFPGGSTQSQKFGLYVGNVDSSISLDVLKQCFAQYGQIVSAALNGRETDPFRFAFLDFATETDRNRALSVNGYQLAGRALKVGVSRGGGGRDGPPRTMQRDDGGMGGGMMGGGGGGMMGGGGGGGMAPPAHGAGYGRREWRGVNELPSERVLKMRELQKKQYYEVVEALAEKLRHKVEKKLRSRSTSVDSTATDPAKAKREKRDKDKKEKKDKKDKKSKKEKKDKKGKKEKKDKKRDKRSGSRSASSSQSSRSASRDRHSPARGDAEAGMVQADVPAPPPPPLPTA